MYGFLIIYIHKVKTSYLNPISKTKRGLVANPMDISVAQLAIFAFLRI